MSSTRARCGARGYGVLLHGVEGAAVDFKDVDERHPNFYHKNKQTKIEGWRQALHSIQCVGIRASQNTPSICTVVLVAVKTTYKISQSLHFRKPDIC